MCDKFVRSKKKGGNPSVDVFIGSLLRIAASLLQPLHCSAGGGTLDVFHLSCLFFAVAVVCTSFLDNPNEVGSGNRDWYWNRDCNWHHAVFPLTVLPPTPSSQLGPDALCFGGAVLDRKVRQQNDFACTVHRMSTRFSLIELLQNLKDMFRRKHFFSLF